MPWIEINGVWTFVAADATEHATATPALAPARRGSWFARHKVMTGVGAGVVALGIIGAVAPSDSAPPASASSQTQPGAQTPAAPVVETPASAEAPAVVEPEVVEPEAPAVVEPEPEPEPEPAKPSITVAQSNAVRKAESYLDYSAFSRKGLIDQLEYNGFSTADATYGATHAGADWMEQAAKKAQSYLEFTAFSRQGLIDQLEYNGFTSAQARHGATKVGL